MECLNATLVAEASCDTSAKVSRFIKRIAMPTVCAFGIVGNILNLTILTRRKLKKSFRTLEHAANLCLIALAVSDLMFCIVAFPTMFLPENNRYASNTGPLVKYRMYGTAVINVFIMESTLLTVTMSLERFMAICFPLRQDLYLTSRRIKYVIFCTVIFSILFNIPCLWRFEVVPHCGYAVANTTSGSSNSSTEHGYNRTGLPSLSQAFSKLGTAIADSVNPSPSDHTGKGYKFPDCEAGIDCLIDMSNRLATPSTSHSGGLLTRLTTASSGATSIPKSSLDLASGSVRRSSVHSSPSSFSSISVAVPSSLADGTALHLTGGVSNSTTHVTETFPILYYTVEEINYWEWDATYRMAWAIAGNFLPLILLFYFNVCLWRNIFRSYRMRRQFHRPNQSTRSSHILTLTLIVIVLMFFILVAPSELGLYIRLKVPLDPATANVTEDILNLMQTFNFSVNFILYCIISPYFRKTLKHIMFCGVYNIYQVSREWKKDFETSLM
ncbi:FMRFamide receptor [Plakobranchus ocellatus]|uniref:FMRFamide receptor n=1 Tax=Plakobranchus ocellatus TaxID=259542 RepID=A0AAV4BPI2_9GAST|nr:FMRFamide receptor [Plakobranchus ocellatus]